jgi:L-aspartate oxidase
MSRIQSVDVLVLGSGIAGLTYALKAATHGSVAIVTKKERAASSTNYAQGGIAAVMAPGDETALHVRDTLVAGAGLCHAAAVHALVQEGPARVRELIDWGVQFSRSAGDFSFGREGGHSHRRILHAGDSTGREIERALLQAVADHPGIELYEDTVAIDLLVCDTHDGETRDGDHTADRTAGDTGGRCGGALVLDHRVGELIEFHACVTLLATGGFGQAYRHTTNPDIATGDGVAMAYRAGASIANLEFVQFHPTALYPAEQRAFLISEAVRGEGAVLRRLTGELLHIDHPLGSLAPRDIVARHIDRYMKDTGAAHALLDLSPIPDHELEERFPGILAECAARGLDIRREPIPVVPAAHYACGGVLTDQEGRTTIRGLYAAGEVACTGVHGANRLASNSLLEAVVFSHRASDHVAAELHTRCVAPAVRGARPAVAERRKPVTEGLEQLQDASEIRSRIRDCMWESAGIVRRSAALREAAAELSALRVAVEAIHDTRPLDADVVEVRNLACVAQLVIESALQRHESRGLHYNEDHPYRDNERFLRDTILVACDTE